MILEKRPCILDCIRRSGHASAKTTADRRRLRLSSDVLLQLPSGCDFQHVLLAERKACCGSEFGFLFTLRRRSQGIRMSSGFAAFGN